MLRYTVSMTALPTLHPNARVDLHMHSDRSDGRYAPEHVLKLAGESGLDVIALTDHDLPAQLPVGPQEVEGHTVHVLHAVEVSGWHGDQELHLLVYFPGEMPEDFRLFCTELAKHRADRYERALENLALEGVTPPDQASRDGERAITRLHLAQALVDAGHAENLRQAFGKWVGNHTAKVPHVTLSMADAIARARAAGGLTSWAHPSLDQARAYLPELVDLGVQGVEVFRPRVGSKTRRELGRFSRRHKIVATGGSDWHGWYRHELGEFSVQAQQLGGFFQALQALS